MHALPPNFICLVRHNSSNIVHFTNEKTKTLWGLVDQGNPDILARVYNFLASMLVEPSAILFNIFGFPIHIVTYIYGYIHACIYTHIYIWKGVDELLC